MLIIVPLEVTEENYELVLGMALQRMFPDGLLTGEVKVCLNDTADRVLALLKTLSAEPQPKYEYPPRKNPAHDYAK